jgi:hypothetical protein
MAMTGLWVFAGLEFMALVAFVICRWRLKTSLPVGIGGANENLQQARELYRAAFIWALVGLAAFGGALVLGLNGAPAWRETGIGGAVLDIGAIFAGCGFVWSMAMSAREEWSPNGSSLGVVRETLSGFLFGGLLMLALYLRFGA